jgi:hypothetical protein
LHTAFHLRNHDTGEWYRDTFEVERDSGEGEWELEVDHLWRAKALGYSNCALATEADNQAELEAEAQVYLDAWAAHFDEIKNKRHVSVSGIHPVATNGKIAQIVHRVGRGQVPQTRVSMNFEART